MWVGLKGVGALEEPRRQKHRNCVRSAARRGTRACQGLSPIIESGDCKPLIEIDPITVVSVKRPHLSVRTY